MQHGATLVARELRPIEGLRRFWIRVVLVCGCRAPEWSV